MNKVLKNWPYFYFKASFKPCYLLLILLVFSLPCNAGIFSTLSKIGKTINSGDINIPLNKLELPHDIGNHTTSHIKLNADNEWRITHKDGTTTPIDNLPSQKTKNIALIIQQSDLPKSLHQLDNLPDNMPVFIQGKQGRLFKYQRGKPATLKYKNVLLQVASMDEVLDGLWLLQRPPVNRSPRFVQIDDTARSTPPANVANSNLDVESISAESLINSMHSFKYQTLILSGKIIDGRLTGIGRNTTGVSLKKLQQLANDKDINLVILESKRPDLVLKKLSVSMQGAIKNVNVPYDTTGDFFNLLRDPTSPAPVVLHQSRSGNRQVAIQWKPTTDIATPKTSNLSGEILIGMPFHLLLQSAKIYLPDQQRSQELNDRIIPGIPSWIQFYILFSVILGFITPGTSWRLWKKIWALRPRREYQYLIAFLMLWLIHRLFFLVLFMPVLGGFSFVWFLILTTYQIINFILVRPTRWIYQFIK